MLEISKEAAEVLHEIIEHENEGDYWEKRFESLSRKDESILRGCFKELKDKDMVETFWASNLPYSINVLKDGYLYDQHYEVTQAQTKALTLPRFEKQLVDLIERTKGINHPINVAPVGTNINEYNRPSEEWVNDVDIFYQKYLKDHPLGGRIKTILFHRTLDAYSQLLACLSSIARDREFIDKMNEISETTIPHSSGKALHNFDVFLSHANKDKLSFVDELNESLKRLRVTIFYDKESLEWGDNWKQRILDGTKQAEFAIIVISENFFDREWTERELNEFLNRQNQNGQKLILPILHGISAEQMSNKYPKVADIQAIDSKTYTCDQIALLFAGQLIKRLKSM